MKNFLTPFSTTSSDFSNYLETMIEILSQETIGIKDEDVLENFPKKNEVKEILIFLPIAMCRLLLPNLKWIETYIVVDDKNKQIRKHYKKNPIYNNIITELKRKIENGSIDQSSILKIAGRSAEFEIINSVLKTGGKIEGIHFTEAIIII